MVDYSSLENYRTERYRGFESLSLRTLNEKPAGFSGLFSFHSPLRFRFSCRGVLNNIYRGVSVLEIVILWNNCFTTQANR